MIALIKNDETAEFNADIQPFFYNAVTAIYPPDSHLKQHGDMAERALGSLYMQYESCPEGIDVIKHERGEDTLFIFQTRHESKPISVKVPFLEALTWHYQLNKPRIESIISMLPSRFDPQTRWAYALIGFYNSTGELIPVRIPPVRAKGFFEFSKFIANLPILSEVFTERIKLPNIKRLNDYLSSFNLPILPEVDIYVSGNPTALLHLNVATKPEEAFFRTAFIANEKMPTILRDIQVGIR